MYQSVKTRTECGKVQTGELLKQNHELVVTRCHMKLISCRHQMRSLQEIVQIPEGHGIASHETPPRRFLESYTQLTASAYSMRLPQLHGHLISGLLFRP